MSSFFCVFSRYLWNEDSSVDLTLILPYSAPGLFIAQSIFRELLSAFSNVVLLRHVTFCDSQFIQQQEDTQWVLRTTMGEYENYIPCQMRAFVLCSMITNNADGEMA